MYWVTCKLNGSGQTKQYNLAWLKATEDKGDTACVLEFITGEKVVVQGNAASVFATVLRIEP